VAQSSKRRSEKRWLEHELRMDFGIGSPGSWK
jgi:hypothetical protein